MLLGCSEHIPCHINISISSLRIRMYRHRDTTEEHTLVKNWRAFPNAKQTVSAQTEDGSSRRGRSRRCSRTAEPSPRLPSQSRTTTAPPRRAALPSLGYSAPVAAPTTSLSRGRGGGEQRQQRLPRAAS
jgi:hypothetical protein